MAAYGFSALLPTNVKVSGIASIAVEEYTTGGSAADTLDTFTNFRDGKVSISTLSAKNKTGMSKPIAVEMKASWTSLPTTLGVIEALDALSTGRVDRAGVILQNGDHIVLAAAINSNDHIGNIKWKYVIEGDVNAERYIEMELMRRLLLSNTAAYMDLDDIFGTWSTVNSTPTLPAAAAGDIKPAGFSTFAVQNTGEIAYEIIGPIRNGKLSLELLCTTDSEGRYLPLGTVMVNVEVDVLDTTPATLAVLDTFSETISNDYQITMVDGQVWTFLDNLGIEWDYTNDNDMTDAAVLKIRGQGIVLLSALDGLVA